jgi:PAS domain S-box-containing protein
LAVHNEALGEVLDDAPFGFVSFEDDGTIRLVNQTALELLGFAAEELLGRSVETILAVGSRIFYHTHFFPLLSLHGRADEIYLILRSHSAEPVGVLVNARRRVRGGATLYDCAFLRVREREKFEHELVAARRAAEEAHSVLSSQAKQLAEANELLESQALELELQHQSLEEQAAELEAQADDLRDMNDLLLDRTVELEALRRIAEDANRGKSEFLARMSHDLRTPLNAISGYAELMELGVHGPVTEAQTNALARIRRAQQHLLTLINDILSYARLEAGQVQVAEHEVGVRLTLLELEELMRPHADQRRISLRIEPGDDSLRVSGDQERLMQVLINLVSNALKFTESGGSVRVAAHPEGERVRFEVSDTGRGIPADRIEAIFEPFVQARDTAEERREGVGLGLAISRELIRMMQGELTVSSEEGVGSLFSVRLPRWIESD